MRNECAGAIDTPPGGGAGPDKPRPVYAPPHTALSHFEPL